ncbi:MAG: glycosyltransferase family 2 protein [Alphaproteobacteria bacterium]
MSIGARRLQEQLDQAISRAPGPAGRRIAVLLPCHNEAATIADVVKGFRAELPDADIYVFDNLSTDDTAAIAEAAGAIVRREPDKGKGNVVRRMFADIDANIYVMADGDRTYDPRNVHALIDCLTENNLDMVIGRRAQDQTAYRAGHLLGNRLFNLTVEWLFGRGMSDMLSGYRVFSRRFVKSFPALSSGFEVETELTIHALDLRMPFAEIPVSYYDRPAGSSSKLRTLADGIAILKTIVLLLKDVRPFLFFGIIAGMLASVALALSIPIFLTFLATGLVPQVPTAILCTGLMILSFLSLTCGAILDSVSRFRRETKRLIYLLSDGRG